MNRISQLRKHGCHSNIIAFAVTLSLLITWTNVGACSAVVLKKDSALFLAKNFDWTLGDGMLVRNPRGANKVAWFTHSGKQAQWKSKYASVTFNQNGKDMPYGGMNEKGLVVEMLWLDVTRFNISDRKDYVNELEWIQYQLDNFESVEHALIHLYDLQVYPVKGKIHYMLVDASGRSMIIEFINGKPIAYEAAPNVCQAITNRSVTVSADYKDTVKKIKKKNTSPLYRYYKLEQRIRTIDTNAPTQQTAFELLDDVAITSGDFRTQWSIVYDVRARKISFRTAANNQVKSVTIGDIGNEPGFISFDDQQAGLASAWKPLTLDVNTESVVASFANLGLDEGVARELAQHQLTPAVASKGLFPERYFHFDLSFKLGQDTQIFAAAIMDSEESFKSRKAVDGGYLRGTAPKGTVTLQAYGLKRGRYSLIAFIDANSNGKLDFEKSGLPSEKVVTFAEQLPALKKDFNFQNTSADFNGSNTTKQFSLN